MNDVVTMTGTPRPLDVDGRVYQVYPLTVDDFAALQAWVDAQTPDPFALVADQIGTGRFTMAQEQHLLKAAIEVAQKPKPSIGSPEADRLVKSLEGVRHIFFLSVRKGDPKFTEEDAAKLFNRIGLERAAQVLKLAAVDQVIGDPKAETPAG